MAPTYGNLAYHRSFATSQHIHIFPNVLKNEREMLTKNHEIMSKCKGFLKSVSEYIYNLTGGHTNYNNVFVLINCYNFLTKCLEKNVHVRIVYRGKQGILNAMTMVLLSVKYSHKMCAHATLRISTISCL